MNSRYYKDDLKPILMRYFKQSVKEQQPSNKGLVYATNWYEDPVELLQYLGASRYVIDNESTSIIIPLITDIKKIATQDNYFTRDGSTVTEVIQVFNKLIKNIKAREMEVQGAEARVKEKKASQSAERSVQNERNSIDINITQNKTTKVAVEEKAVKGKNMGSEIEPKHNKAENEGEDDDGDWEVLEESEIHGFEVIEAHYEL